MKNKQISIPNQDGFTIVELILYMGLLSIFMTVLVTLFVSILKLQLTTQSASSLTQDVRLIISKLSYDLGGAQTILVPGTLGQTTSSLQFVKDGVSYTYSLDGDNNLVLSSAGDTSKLNGLDTSIASISFKRLGFIGGTPTVQVVFTINSEINEQSGTRSQIIQTTYGLR